MRTDRRQHISNSQLIDQIKATNDQNRLTGEKIRALLDALPSAVRTAAIMGRAAGKVLKAARKFEKQQAFLQAYGASAAKMLEHKGRVMNPIVIDEVARLNDTIDEISEGNNLRRVLDSLELNSPKSGRSGGVSVSDRVSDRGPKRSLIERSKAALMDFRAFASRKAGKAYRVERWRRG